MQPRHVLRRTTRTHEPSSDSETTTRRVVIGDDPSMLTLAGFPCPWNILTPTLFRYLPAAYVDAFFKDGSLRLSSFARFKSHADEQRFDDKEGRTLFIHSNEQNGGQTLSAWMQHGFNAYVLCGTIRHDDSLMQTFGCDSYIRINDPTTFAAILARHVPNVRGGAEGLCLYQQMKIIERDLGYIDFAKFPSDPSDSKKPSKVAIDRLVNDAAGIYPYFLKDRTYVHQAEYRLVWITEQPVDGVLDIKIPEGDFNLFSA
jgi:hypothetical protein